jgi:hypothetical protein
VIFPSTDGRELLLVNRVGREKFDVLEQVHPVKVAGNVVISRSV